MTTGEKIRKYRKERGFTQIELSSKANLSRSYVADIENSRYNPSIDALQRLADVLCVPVSAIVGDASFLELVASDNGMSAAYDLLQNAKRARPDDGDELDEVSAELVDLLVKLTPQESEKAAAYIQGLLAAREE